jgi:hypothetical protein
VPTLQRELVRVVAQSGLAALGLHFVLGPDSVWRYPAERPAPGWHGHGAYAATIADLAHGRLVDLRVAKPRWLHPETNTTVHTEPPSDLGVRFSALVVAVQLFAWIDAGVGVHHFESLFTDLDDRPSRRTVQRWLARLLPHALVLQHHARRAVLACLEHRSPDILFPGGIPPPPAVRSRPWRDPNRVDQLFRGLAMVLGAAIAVDAPAVLLVTEAWWKVEHRTTENG